MAILSKRRRRRLMRVFRAAHAKAAPSRQAAGPIDPGTAGVPRPKYRARTPDVAGAARDLLGDRSRRAALVTCLALILVALHAATASLYVVKGARIVGNARIGGAAVYAASGLDGTRVFALNGDAVAQRILANLPEVRAARISVRLPARVTIAVVETQPVLAWQSGPSLLMIDETGHAIVPPAEGAGAEALPQVADVGTTPLGLGEQLPLGRVAAAVAYADAFGDLVYRPGDGFIATLADGCEVRLGEDAGQLPAQRLALDALRGHLGRAAASAVVDLRFPAHPVYRLDAEGGRP